MNGTAATAATGITSMIATIIVWVGNSIAHGQWFPVDAGTSNAIAGLVVAAFSSLSITGWNKITKSKTTDTSTVSVETTKTP